jgi:hypothetical protein
MKSSPPENTGPHEKPRGRMRGIEGYLSLALMALLFVIPFLPVPYPPMTEAIGLAILILVLVLALRGIRPRPSGNRAAAWTSLVIVFITMLTTAVIACIEFLRVPLESHPSR